MTKIGDILQSCGECRHRRIWMKTPCCEWEIKRAGFLRTGHTYPPDHELAELLGRSLPPDGSIPNWCRLADATEEQIAADHALWARLEDEEKADPCSH